MLHHQDGNKEDMIFFLFGRGKKKSHKQWEEIFAQTKAFISDVILKKPPIFRPPKMKAKSLQAASTWKTTAVFHLAFLLLFATSTNAKVCHIISARTHAVNVCINIYTHATRSQPRSLKFTGVCQYACQCVCVYVCVLVFV